MTYLYDLPIGKTVFALAGLFLRGMELTDDERGNENGLVSWVDTAAECLNKGYTMGYYLAELRWDYWPETGKRPT